MPGAGAPGSPYRHDPVRRRRPPRRLAPAARRHGTGAPWWQRRGLELLRPRGSIRLAADGTLEVPPWPLPQRAPRRPDLRVGVILDDFTSLALGYEWDQVALLPDRWREQVDSPRRLDLLFVESAWHGNGDAWQYPLTGTSAPRPAIVELVPWCREHGVPTVFWNKEDPVHYAEFLDAARLFDHCGPPTPSASRTTSATSATTGSG